MSEFQFYVDSKDFGFRKELMIVLNHDMDRRAFAAPLVFTELQPGEIATGVLQPTISETGDFQYGRKGMVIGFMQAALDAAWALGLRPQGAPDQSAELKATRYHLEDMRALAKVPAPPVPREGLK